MLWDYPYTLHMKPWKRQYGRHTYIFLKYLVMSVGCSAPWVTTLVPSHWPFWGVGISVNAFCLTRFGDQIVYWGSHQYCGMHYDHYDDSRGYGTSFCWCRPVEQVMFLGLVFLRLPSVMWDALWPLRRLSWLWYILLLVHSSGAILFLALSSFMLRSANMLKIVHGGNIIVVSCSMEINILSFQLIYLSEHSS